MIVHNEYRQRSTDWMLARSAIPTASEFDALLTPKLEPRKGQMPTTYLHRKLAEWWQGGPLATFNTWEMDAGEFLEREAVPFAELEYGVKLDRVGFITTDDGRIGCSPDGMANGEGWEIKCCQLPHHIGWLMDGELPEEHSAQVYGSLYVTGAENWHFLSYYRRCPALHVVVDRKNDAIMEHVGDALETFLERFEAAKARLCEINGGPPRRDEPKPKVEPVPAWLSDDIIP